MTIPNRNLKFRAVSVSMSPGSDPDVIEMEDAEQVYDVDSDHVPGVDCFIDKKVHKTRCCRCGELVYL